MRSTHAYPTLGRDNTYHINSDGEPAYSLRFRHVGKFHAPGLAPVHNDSGWFHIHPDGESAYAYRYEYVWGFYCGMAAAKDSGGWMHVDMSGTPIYGERYVWVGNFQEGLCPVQSNEGFFHIDTAGRRAYTEIHAYVGDFRDGVAVATSSQDSLSRHITSDGKLLHFGAFSDLDIFHKGFARAKDSRGWFHIRPNGQACYPERYVSVESFYNGLSRADSLNGSRVRIDCNGTSINSFQGGDAKSGEIFQALSTDIVGYWKSLTITCAVKAGLFEALPGATLVLSEKIRLSPEMVRRLLRATTELDLTSKCQNDCWSLTTKGELLVRSHPTSLAYSALEMAGEHISRWQQLGDTLMGLSSPSDIFEEASMNSGRAKCLQLMMNSYAVRDYSRAISALSLPDNGTIVDAGGGLGSLARQMKASRPRLEVLVLERPEVCEQAATLGMAGAVKWVSGDFTRPWPILADIITMSRVLHDWDDHKCLEILKYAKSSLRPGGRIIILETVLSADGCEGGLCDLHLLAVSGGKERTLSDFMALCASAGLVLSDVREASSLHKALHFKPAL